MRDALLCGLAVVVALLYLAYTLTRGSYRDRSRRSANRRSGNGGVFGNDGDGHGSDCGDGGGDDGGH